MHELPVDRRCAITLCLIVGGFTSLTALADQPQAAPAAAPAATATSNSDDSTFNKNLSKDYKLGPFDLAAGVQTSGDFGATLKGSGIQIIDDWSSGKPPKDAPEGTTYWRFVPDVRFGADAGWTTASNAKNNASLSLRPEFDWLTMKTGTPGGPVLVGTGKGTTASDCTEADPTKCKIDESAPWPGPVSIGVYGDVRYKYGAFDASSGGGVQHANQALYGGGLSLAWMSATRAGLGWGYFESMPRLDVAYYGSHVTGSNTVPVPSDVKADYLDIALHVDYEAPVAGGFLELVADGEASKPTKGADGGNESFQFLSTTQLAYMSKKDSKFKPGIVYRSGKNTGFSYDRQVLFSLIYDFAS